MSIEFDTGPLTWVKGEIDQALGLAGEKLAQFIADASDSTPLRLAQTHLHQVSGAIRMVGLEGAANFGEAIEKLVSALEKHEIAISGTHLDLVGQSMSTLSEYLDGLLNGKPDQPLRLYPQYRALLQARGIEKTNESELFFPDLTLRAPKNPDPISIGVQELPLFLKAERTRYQRGLLGFLKNQEDAPALQAMRDALAAIERTQTVPAQHTFWWSAGGLVESLQHKGIDVNISVKQLCGGIDQQIRRLADGSPKVAERLLRDVLYFISRATPATDRISKIQNLFELDAYIPREQQETEQESLQPLLRELRDIIAPAKDAWLKFTAGSADSLDRFRTQIKHLVSAAAALENAPLNQLLQQIGYGASALAANPGDLNEAVAMEMATAMLLAENTLESYRGVTDEFTRQSEIQSKRLQACLQGTLAEMEESDIPLLDEISRKAQERLLLAQVGQEIQSNLQHIEQVLDTFFRDTAKRDELAGLNAFIKQVYGAFRILDLAPAVELLGECELLINNFSSPDYVPQQEQMEMVAEGLSSLGFYVEAIQRGHTDAPRILETALARFRPAGEHVPEPLAEAEQAAETGSSIESGLQEQKQDVQNLLQQWQEGTADEQAKDRLQQQLTNLQQDADLVADADLKAQATQAKRLLDQAGNAPTSELAAAVAAMTAPKVALAAPSAETAQLAQQTDEAIDAEMLEIYLEEAGEVLGTVGEYLDVSRAQPGDKDALTTLRRSFHTLKGSGRMVGLWDLGEVAWAIEQVMNKWLQEEKIATPELLALLEHAHEQFLGWVAGLKANGTVQVQADALLAEAEYLRTGHLPAASTPPAEPACPVEISAEPTSPEIELSPLPEEEPPELGEEMAAPILGAHDLLPLIEENIPEAVSLESEPALLPETGGETSPAEVEMAEETSAGIPVEMAATFATVPPEEATEPEISLEEIVVSEMPEETPTAGEQTAEPSPESLEPTEVEGETLAVDTPPPAEPPKEESDVTVGSITLPAALYNIFVMEARQHLDTLQRHQEKLRQQPGAIQHDFMRAAHTLCGISRTVGFPAIAELAFPLELWLQEMLLHPAPMSDKSVKLMGDVITSLNKMLGAVQNNKAPNPAKQLIRSLQSALRKAQASRETEPPAAQADAIETMAPATAPAEMVSRDRRAIHDDIDADLLPIFLEEAQDLFPLVGSQLRAWRANTADTQATNGLQRALHTIKGSARMAGAMRLGELTHNMETQVIAAAESGQRPPDLFDTLEAEFDRMADVLEQLRSGPQTVAEGTEETAAPQKIADVTAPLLAIEPETATKAMLRVRADVVDRLVNEAGEVSIARSRIEGEMQNFKRSLLDLTESITRLRGQLREIEIQAESQMQSRQSLAREAHEEFDPLEFDRFTRLQEVTRMMAESVNDVASVQHNLLKNLDETEAALMAQSRMTKELQQELLRARMVPLGSTSERLYRIVRQTAKELGKRATLDIIGEQVELDRSVLEKMTAPFEHLLRNAIDHGLEDQQDRLASDKEETGSIRLQAQQEGNEILITLSDDGRGINLDGIRTKAIELGLLNRDSEATPAQLMELIFSQGFSTASQITQVSGRGIGMDVVRNEIASLGGRVEVSSEAGKGTTFSIYLPLTLAVTQAVLVRSGNSIFALPSTMVDQVQELKADALAEIYRNQQVVWQGNIYPLYYFPRLLGDQDTTPTVQRYTTIMLLHSGAQRVAVHVDELIGNREIVVKNIGPQLARVPGVAGATVLGNGKVVLILNAVHLAQRQGIAHAPSVQQAVAVEHLPAAAPVIMIVDDSLTVRKITSKLLTREGYQVVTAKDGVDALQALEDVSPQVMLVDIEMPRMDGFELTKNVRGNQKTAAIPIIMITSRTAEKHRNYAQELGVNVYLGKPYQEEELLGYIAGFVKGNLH